MENEIKVGEYIRTKLGDIKEITEGFEFIIEIHNKSDNNIVKHSSNLIDLIQCGDYVNGKEVKHIADFEGINKPIKKLIFVDKTHLIPGETAEDKDIKTIVTKEMMESISYKVERKEQ